jgi:HK97 family phage portal protein
MFVPDYTGAPLAGTMRVINPDRWGYTDDGRYLILSDDGEDDLESDYDGAFRVGGVEWRMVTIRNFPPSDGYVAGGALSRSGLVLSTGSKMNSYLNSILGSGVPSGVLRVAVPNYTQPQAEALKDQWMTAHGGSRKSVAVLSAGIDFTPLQLSVVDSDVVAAKSSWLVDIAHAFGLSAAMMDATGGGPNLTYANISDRRRDHLDHSLIGLGRSVEDVVSSLLPWGSSMKIKWADYLGTDPNLSVPWVTAGITQGWMTKAEARDLFNLVPVELDPQQLEGAADEPADSIDG